MDNVIENLKVHPFKSDKGKTVAFVQCKVNTPIGALFLNNMTLVAGSKGLFLSFPSRKLPKPDAKGNEYQSHYFMDRDLKQVIQGEAIDKYNEANPMGGRDDSQGYGVNQGNGGYGQQGGGGYQ